MSNISAVFSICKPLFATYNHLQTSVIICAAWTFRGHSLTNIERVSIWLQSHAKKIFEKLLITAIYCQNRKSIIQIDNREVKTYVDSTFNRTIGFTATLTC